MAVDVTSLKGRCFLICAAEIDPEVLHIFRDPDHSTNIYRWREVNHYSPGSFAECCICTHLLTRFSTAYMYFSVSLYPRGLGPDQPVGQFFKYPFS